MTFESAKNYKQQLIALLAAENLPTADLPINLANFRVAVQNSKIMGAIGLEIYGDYGLLRSLAVLPAFRSKGVARHLVRDIEIMAHKKSLKEIYLLTETAPDYFARKGYEIIPRINVPEAVQRSSEFSYACPQSAIVMKKTLHQL